MSSGGVLYLVATPIGNLEDITLRALRILKETDVILCEDTSVSVKLLNHYGIRKPLVSYYKPREKEKLEQVISLLEEGRTLALITDAGTPLISDPGMMLVNAARERGFTVTAIPGPSSVVTALSASGFNADRFLFEGFLPKKTSELKKRFGEIKDLPHTVVFFVPARDLRDVLTAARDLLGDRRACVARELTKVYEEFRTGSLGELIGADIAEKGELTVVIAGCHEKEGGPDDEELRARLKTFFDKGLTFRDIMKSDEFREVRKNRIYDLWEAMKHDKG